MKTVTETVTRKCYYKKTRKLIKRIKMPKTKVLIVEDEIIIALEMKQCLEKLDFEITNTAKNYNSAIKSCQMNKPDIILMDINLKNSKDGIETVKKIHLTNNIPVIYITAFSDEYTIKRAIETKPVSYLIKPFKREELKSNILLGLYKQKEAGNSYLSTNNLNLGLDYYYNEEKNRLYYKDVLIKLSAKESCLLKVLIDAKGKTVSFEELESFIWVNNHVSKSTLRTLIYRLRSKLEYKLIETMPMGACRINNKYQLNK